MTLEGNEFLLNVLARLFISRWKQTQAVLLLNVMRSDKSILFGIKQSKDDVDIFTVKLNTRILIYHVTRGGGGGGGSGDWNWTK